MLDYLQDMKEEFDLKAIEKFALKQIGLIVNTKALKKYESYKLYFLYCSLSILHMLNKLNQFIFEEQCKLFLQSIVQVDNNLLIKNSPNLSYGKQLQIMDLYFWVVCCYYVNIDFLNQNQIYITEQLQQIQISQDLKDLYCLCFLKQYFKQKFDQQQIHEIQTTVQNCKNYDGGYGFKQYEESHGAALFSAIKILKYIQKLNLVDSKTIYWCINRQKEYGLEGRVNKPKEDSCYTFWIGIIFYELKCTNFIDKDQLQLFLLFCQDKLGGIKKNPWEDQADIIHTFQGLLGALIFGIVDLERPLELIIQLIKFVILYIYFGQIQKQIKLKLISI